MRPVIGFYCPTALFILIVALITWALGADYIAGVKLLKEGNYGEAVQRLEKTHRANPSDAQIAFDYAMVAPCSVAVAIYTRLSEDPKTPDSIRAASYKQLGDYSFVHSAFRTAAERYRTAFSIVGHPVYKHFRAVALAALNDTVSARKIWLELSADSASGGDIALEAQYRLGILDMKAGAYESAVKRFSRAGEIDTTRPLTIAAAAAKLECALRLNNKDSIAVYEKKIRPFREKLLEEDLLDLAGTGLGKSPSAVTLTVGTPIGGPEKDVLYTLQVGAFGSMDNAIALRERLAARFEDVSVLPVTVSDMVFYRVRVGTFKSKTDAEAFGRDSLVTAGTAFKVVVK